VATVAAETSLPVLRAESINAEDVVGRLKAERVEVLVVAAFGQLLKAAVLDPFLCVNVHASLLPTWRGAAPIARSLLAGDPWTGVSIMRMAPGLDEGPWAFQVSRSVGLEEDAGSVGRSLALLGAQGIGHALEALADGTLRWTEQSGDVTYAAKLTAEDRLLDAAEGVRRCHDRVRALSPEIGADLSLGPVAVKVWRTWPIAGDEDGLSVHALGAAEPGRLVRLAARPSEARLFLGCGDGWLELLVVQPQGKRAMRSAEFLRGYGSKIGERVAPQRGGVA
jgi:methionyl-tRNA formyltransferase